MAIWRQTFLTLPGVALFSAALTASDISAAEIAFGDIAPLGKPCVMISDSAEAYAAALRREGWSDADGDNRARAQRQIIEKMRVSAFLNGASMTTDAYEKLFGENSDLTGLAFQGDRFPPYFEDAVFLMRGDDAAAVFVTETADTVAASCLFAGTAIQDISDRLSQADAGPGPAPAWSAFIHAVDVFMLDEKTPVFFDWNELPRPEGATATAKGNLTLLVFTSFPKPAGA
ncbi:hypothetical protein M3484_07410 [Pseudomonas sp. GX19020]|uniref:hypothetical protein n=1 Tax=Pseudomonadota TaxID=1224 RepID=UPI000897FEF9|nr:MULTISPECIES: hypothetical protein [Pseudomonadota]MCL4066394.1 hypothetical protein [Pseudomonas sp. GX19020]SEC80509.1 hypothetical protein SAMN05519105_3323 [Rhodobacter sp. 24-YEA-8]